MKDLIEFYACYGVNADGNLTGCVIAKSHGDAVEWIHNLFAEMIANTEKDLPEELIDESNELIISWAKANTDYKEEDDDTFEYGEYKYIVEPVFMSKDTLREKLDEATVHFAFIDLTDAERDFVRTKLQVPPRDGSECFSEDETFTKTADFGDGIEMDIKMCGVQYEEGEENIPWTEAVLFHNGSQVACTEPWIVFEGDWCLEYNGEKYIVNVR